MSAISSTAAIETAPNLDRLRILRGAGVLIIATTLANAGNYLINLYLGRALGPAGFSEATLLATFVLLTSIVTTAVGLVISRMTAVRLVDGDEQAVADLRVGATRAAAVTGIAIAVPFALLADGLGDAFRMSAAPFLVLAASFPVYLVLSVERGILLGRLRYPRLGASYVLETAVRFAASFVAVTIGLGSAGIAGAIVLSFVAAWWLTRASRQGLPAGRLPGRAAWRELAVAGGAAAAALLGQAVLANSDVVFVKGAFAPEAAGTFAAIALVGRAIFFATTSLTMALFPVVAARAERGEPHRRLLGVVLAVVIVVCGGMTSVAWFAPEFVLGVFFGEDYIAGAALLGPYALSISMLVGSSVIAMYRLSLGRPGSGYLTLAAGVALIAGLALTADSLAAVVQVMVVVNSALLLATALEAGLLGSRSRPSVAVAPA